MSCLAWNCYGLGNLCIGKELVDFRRAKDPSVVFLDDTMVDEARREMIQCNIEFDHQLVVLREGISGGLVLFWKSSINLKIYGFDKYYIDATIEKNIDNKWRMTSFYKEPKTARRIEAWTL